MKNKFVLIIFAIAAMSTGLFAQAVQITGEKVTYKRVDPLSDEKSTFWINHPRVKASTPAISRKIENAISFEKAMSIDIKEEINEIQWLEEADFTVGYNDNGIFTISLWISGAGAYPSTSTKTLVVNTRTGSVVTPADVFIDLNRLGLMVKRDWKKEIDAAIVEIKSDPNYDEPEPEAHFENANFTTADLSTFSVDEKGVTFIYDYGFPQMIKSMEPSGKYFYDWAQLKPFIKRGGLLSRIAR